jgi:glycogen debranching enzyme
VIHRKIVSTTLEPISLASDEELVDIKLSPLVLPSTRIPPIEVLQRLGRVASPEKLGGNGPLLASAVNPENADNSAARRYEAVFGRDALYAAEFLCEEYPQLEDATVLYLAAFQATDIDPSRQAEPGKIPNHIRSQDDPIAQALTRETGRGWPWYGATDTTVQFLSALCRLLIRRPEAAIEPVRRPPPVFVDTYQQVAEQRRPRLLKDVTYAATGWLLRALRTGPVPHLVWVGMNDKDSFTVWTDSPNAFSSPEGQLARPPVAPVQLQAQAYDALCCLAHCAGSLPELQLDPDELLTEAQLVRQTVLDRFVIEAMHGLQVAAAAEIRDGRLVPVASRTVNVGFVLVSSLLDGAACGELRESLVRQLFSAEMSSPFGIVGRARDEVRFEPFDYHSQVWAFAVHQVARGLRRAGYPFLARELDARVIRQTQDGLLPENVGANADPELRYCPHLLRVARLAADGRPTVTTKERPPAPYAAWTAAAVEAIDNGARRLPVNDQISATPFEAQIHAGVPAAHRAYFSPDDLCWRSD